MLTSEDILSVASDNIPAFVQKQASEKTLSQLIKQLNTDLIAGDATARDMAARALEHMGFVESA